MAFSHKIDYFTLFEEILNLEGHPNCITGSKVMAILLNWLILLIGGVASGRVCVWSLCSRLVFTHTTKPTLLLNWPIGQFSDHLGADSVKTPNIPVLPTHWWP